ncbi:hypothetical protein DID78_06960 [Candidatus Marinamargulisbacteria bacterium SCGC AG-343-D04]|nr:hypothetical protein DID78_06960 [Candidatus Marinamargulisbacteria bacterium SCGC AG-343-D04]
MPGPRSLRKYDQPKSFFPNTNWNGIKGLTPVASAITEATPRNQSSVESFKPIHPLPPIANVPTPRDQLREVSSKPMPPVMKERLSHFIEGTDISFENFAEGIKKFTTLVNLDVETRESLFGSRYLGLHYANELAEEFPEIKSFDLDPLCSKEWEFTPNEEGCKAFVYKGKRPAEALDSFVKGPGAIDCGMFTQLSIWFGIRYMLGNEEFNQLFGNTPLYITQLNYNSVADPKKPYLGNPLYPFFSAEKSEPRQVSVCYLENDPLYKYKHPGGGYMGENCIKYCIETGDQYTIFDPSLESTQDISPEDINAILVAGFNKDQDIHDEHVLETVSRKPKEIHPVSGVSYEELTKFAAIFKDEKTEPSKCGKLDQSLYFNLKKFQEWVLRMSHDSLRDLAYEPEKNPTLSAEVLEAIPAENSAMNFDFFRSHIKTSKQQELFNVAKKFCSDVVNGQSAQVVLKGNAGVGKTASAVCCAKELGHKGKKVVWLSEKMVKNLADQAKSRKEIEQGMVQITSLLQDADAVFLDDDNLTSYTGKALLEKVYDWFVSNSGKGLFITSNKDLNIGGLYGYKYNREYLYSPFSGYDSPQYLSVTERGFFQGSSLRETGFDRDSLPKLEVDQMTELSKMTSPQSTGIIVSHESYEEGEEELNSTGQVELVPGFRSLAPITSSMVQTGTLGSYYDSLSPVRKQWLEQFGAERTIRIKPFSFTDKRFIAVELMEHGFSYTEPGISVECFNQLLRVIHFAHDEGEKRVIIINKTDTFTNEGLWKQIIAQVPPGEKERTIDRLRVLLGIK